MDQVMNGDKVRMTDLRVGETYDVTVISVEADGKVIVQRDDTKHHYRVGLGFLTARR